MVAVVQDTGGRVMAAGVIVEDMSLVLAIRAFRLDRDQKRKSITSRRPSIDYRRYYLNNE